MIARYALMGLAILNIITSILVIVYDRIETHRAEEELPDDWYTKTQLGGSYAKYWFASCVMVNVISCLASFLGMFGAYKEHSEICMLYSLLMTLVAVYGAFDIYTRYSVIAYLVPLIVSATALLYGMLNYRDLLEQVEGQYLKVSYTKQPTETVPEPTETEKFQPE